MHELSLAQGLLDTALSHPAAAGGSRITSVDLRIGVLSGVEVESLVFCFGLVSKGTQAEGAELRVERAPVRARCQACSVERNLEAPAGSPAVAALDPDHSGKCACGETAFDLVGGHEIVLVQMEIDTESGISPRIGT